MKKILLASAMAIAALAGSAQAAPDTPASVPGVETVDNDYVAKAAAAGTSLLVDFRGAAAFAAGSLPGAVNCPGGRQDPTELSAAEIGAAVEVVSACAAVTAAPRDREVIAFCGHAQCWVSPKAALALKQLNFTKVRWLRGGVDGWKVAGQPLR